MSDMKSKEKIAQSYHPNYVHVTPINIYKMNYIL